MDECPVVDSECEKRVNMWYGKNTQLYQDGGDRDDVQSARQSTSKPKSDFQSQQEMSGMLHDTHKTPAIKAATTNRPTLQETQQQTGKPACIRFGQTSSLGTAQNLCLHSGSSLKSNTTIRSLLITIVMFVCNSNNERIHYTFVCDFRPDCSDESDETFCRHSPCDGFTCRNGQCVKSSQRCDEVSQCFDNSDEFGCGTTARDELVQKSPPGLTDLDGVGGYVSREYSENTPCPETHFRCASEPSYCLPVYTRCNGFYDCLGHEDEWDCEDVVCPGFYRCKGSSVCVHLDQLTV